MIKRLQTLSLFLFIAFTLFAQIPSNYYVQVEKKNGAELKTAFFNVIKVHKPRSYKQLWSDFQKTDMREDGKVWDMYSTATFSFGTHQDKGSGKNEGEFYNREHSFPKSWFNDDTPMFTDLFHLYPTDKIVNNRRSNYPFGETNGEAYKSNSNLSKLGACTFPGYTGTVFEPADEYKGDFARTYFYMVTCYQDKVPAWSGNEVKQMLNQTAYPCFNEWALNLLLKWSRQDPVSEKEVKRNEAVYKLQENRNPFIDYPQLAEYIWGNKTDKGFVTSEKQGTGIENVKSQVSLIVQNGTVSISASEPSDVYVYSLSGTLLMTENAVTKTSMSIASKGIFIVKVVAQNRINTYKVSI